MRLLTGVVAYFILAFSHAALDLATVKKIFEELKLNLEAQDKQLADQIARFPAQTEKIVSISKTVKGQNQKICKLRDKITNEKNQCSSTEAILKDLNTKQAVEEKIKQIQATKEPVFVGLKTGINVALKKPAKQSSTHGNNVASKAVDGNVNPDAKNGFCAHTKLVAGSWWCVDLQKLTDIVEIEVTNRKSENSARLVGFEIKLRTSGGCNAAEFKKADICYKDKTTKSSAKYSIKQCNVGNTKTMRARYVFISKPEKQWLTLCEVKIFEGINVALKKPAKQSSTLGGEVASKAVDGNVNPDASKGSCSHTNNEAGSWWCVDLQKLTNIGQIELTNRKSDSAARLVGFEIKLRTSGGCNAAEFKKADICYKDKTTKSAAKYSIKQCNVGNTKTMTARYVFVSKPEKQFLTLCEVKIFEGLYLK